MRDVAGELPRAMNGDGLRLVAGEINDLDLTRFHNEEVQVPVTDRKQRLPVAVTFAAASVQPANSLICVSSSVGNATD